MYATRLRWALVGLALPVLATASALAGTAADKAAESEKLLAAGKPLEAYQAISAAVDAIWDKMPLTIGKAVYVVGNPAGFGVYNPRESTVFKPGEKMVIYVESQGYGFAKINGIYGIRLQTGIAVKDASGKVVFKKSSFGDFKLRSRKKNREFFLKLTISLNGAPEGNYTLVVPIKDLVKGGQTQFSLPFTIKK
jgi:hypothetical protein